MAPAALVVCGHHGFIEKTTPKTVNIPKRPPMPSNPPTPSISDTINEVSNLRFVPKLGSLVMPINPPTQIDAVTLFPRKLATMPNND
eukprot:CAMPEP_0172463520 /NCGR_PEP_ID=MMETSP1065-20121228/47495_1 /TAXON_ID=265537 /ORGANISM="Amphiprora paludosa, Strain CCMP125" /LENGTH=86 /DNA_ID=CAMNT_0013219489 /DNA_START=35 /DNA_END=292 /DNA_ORIENTATION=+